MGKHVISDLWQMQSLPLEAKIRMTKYRIRQWVEYYGEDGVCSRTGCMFCGYGCHLEKSPTRFEQMKETHPKQYAYIMKPVEEGGLGYKDVIDWINQHGNMDIKY